jgi:hypothetical protein
MSEKTIINNIIEQLKTLTLLEAAELVKEIETVFGVDASVSVGAVSVAPAAAAAPQEWGRADRERYTATDFREEPNDQPDQGQGQFRGDAQRRGQTRGPGYQGKNWRPQHLRHQDRAGAGST